MLSSFGSGVLQLYLLIVLLITHGALAGPLRIFVLAGQSNMVGPASIEHLSQLVTNTSTSEEYQHLWSGTNWTQRDDVVVRFEQQFGNLTVGYGYSGQFGPELEFGWTVGDAIEDKILLIKTAWGGKSLAVEFRPPSSGIGNYSYPPIYFGNLYRLMVAEIYETLAKLEFYVRGYNKSGGYVLSGLVWFQGWSDLSQWSMVDEYKHNLINLIHDIRLDLNSPNLPIVIGELGQGGLDPPTPDKDKIFAIRRSQEEVASLKEYKGKVRFVKTSIYVDNDAQQFNGIHHYWGRADTFCHIGRAFGKAMLVLIHGSQNKYKEVFLKPLHKPEVDIAEKKVQ
jgi:alpha-galactosidase